MAAQIVNPRAQPTLGRFRIFRRNISFRDTNPALASFTRIERQLLWERSTLKRNQGMMEGLEDIVGQSGYPPQNGMALLQSRLGPAVLLLYNVRYLITLPDDALLAAAQNRGVYIDKINDLAVIELSGAWPRAYWVPAIKRAADERQAEARLRTTDPARYAVITTTENLPEEDAGSLTLQPARITRYDPDEVQISVQTSRPGWLVLSDRFYPGWRATVDGNPTPIYRANVMVRALRLDAGKHRIIFTYRPTYFLAGVFISLLAWLVLGAVGLVVYRRHRGENRVQIDSRRQ